MAQENKSPGALVGLMAFLAWLTYGTMATRGRWTAATGGGAMLCLLYLFVLGQRSTIKLMDWVMLAYFLTAGLIMIGLGSTTFPVYHVIVIWSFFAIPAWVSLVVGAPFTATYAREQAPPEIWEHPAFHRLNVIMTVFWAVLLSVNVGLAALGVMLNRPATLGFLAPNAMLICGFVFSARYPLYYQQRFQTAEVGAAAVAGNS